MEPHLDVEFRAITAHVLLPVGADTTEHVLETCTSLTTDQPVDHLSMSVRGGAGWLVVPVPEPADWTDDHARCLVELQNRDHRHQSDLGRFLPNEEPVPPGFDVQGPQSTRRLQHDEQDNREREHRERERASPT
jgi:hypothetical protein